MVRHHKGVRKVPIKEIGLDIKSISSEILEEMAKSANEVIREELERSLPLRNDYIVTSSMELHENTLTVTFDVLLQSFEPITPEESAYIEEVIDKGLKVIEDKLAQKYGKTRD